MSKKILILNGSPRKTGNTAALIRSFAEGAESAAFFAPCTHTVPRSFRPPLIMYLLIYTRGFTPTT